MAEPQEAPRIRPGGTDTLSQALEEQQETYAQKSLAGHPAEEDTPAEDAPVEPEQLESHPADTGTSEGTPPVAPAPPAVPSRTLRYTTHEEAERAAEEARTRMHEAATEAAEWRRRYLEQEDRLRQQPVTPPEPPHPPAPPVPAFNAREHFRQAYKRIDALDPTAEEYEAQQQEILVEAQAEAFERIGRQQPTLTPEEIERRATAAAESVVQRAESVHMQRTEQERLTAKLLGYAREHGLDVTPPTEQDPFGGRHYEDLMKAVTRNMYPADADEDHAIAAVTDVVRQRWGIEAAPPANGTPPGATTTPPPRPSAAEAPLVPMERAGVGRTSAPQDDLDARPMKLDELLERSMTMRRP